MASLEVIDLSAYASTTDLDKYATLVSPALSGTPTAPTAAKTVNNTQIATTAFVHLLAGAANNGGIVDSSLAQNGYVKFANGLILQWGYCSSRTATFPIPFPTAALFIVAVPKTTSTSATASGAEYLGTTSVNLYLHGTSGWYFVGGH